MKESFFPPVHIPGARAVSDECTWKKHHAECTVSWCECACHERRDNEMLVDNIDRKSPHVRHSTIYLIGPKPTYLKYFHNLLEGGFADSITHESSYTVELTFVDRQSDDSLLGVKSITLDYELEPEQVEIKK